mmetsp:Transcript_25359/g.74005  ORF Transcript_25359/g.74005 Transcript_25359/m.74005 type:complete len:336 (+) Transcript_25359:60-1067(+)
MSMNKKTYLSFMFAAHPLARRDAPRLSPARATPPYALATCLRFPRQLSVGDDRPEHFSRVWKRRRRSQSARSPAPGATRPTPPQRRSSWPASRALAGGRARRVDRKLVPIGGELDQPLGHHAPDVARLRAVLHPHPLEGLVIVVDLERRGKVEKDLLLVLRHLAVDDCLLFGVDQNERQRNAPVAAVGRRARGARRGAARRSRGRVSRAVALDEVHEGDLLRDELLQVQPLLVQPILPAREVHLHASALLLRVAGQAFPQDLLLLLGDDLHGHEHVEGVVDAPPDVLLVVLHAVLARVAHDAGVDKLRHELVRNLVVRGPSLLLHLLANLHAEVP